MPHVIQELDARYLVWVTVVVMEAVRLADGVSAAAALRVCGVGGVKWYPQCTLVAKRHKQEDYMCCWIRRLDGGQAMQFSTKVRQNVAAKSNAKT